MPNEVKRERMMYEGNLVTVLEQGNKRGKTLIRNAFGYEELVPTKELVTLDRTDERKTLTFVPPGE